MLEIFSIFNDLSTLLYVSDNFMSYFNFILPKLYIKIIYKIGKYKWAGMSKLVSI